MPCATRASLRVIGTPVAGSEAVVNFGAIHHVVRWRQAISEIVRVLKPGGAFYCEEILSRYTTHPLLGRLMDHPQEDRFTSGPAMPPTFQIVAYHRSSRVCTRPRFLGYRPSLKIPHSRVM
jgi:SAM-dependent methyltransferase